MSNKNLYLAKIKEDFHVDLTHADELRSNNLYPFGRHNYAIYRTEENLYVKGTNQHSPEHMLDTFELIEKEEAENYKHPFIRKDDSEVLPG